MTSRGRKLEEIIKELRLYMIGWAGYFRVCKTPSVFAELDKWIRRRLRCVIIKHRQRTHRKWAAAFLANKEFPISYFDTLGLPRLEKVTSTS